MNLRTVFFLLILVNLVFFTWTQGYWGTFVAGHEPQRLGQQLNAEKLKVAPGKSIGDCRLIDGLNETSAQALKKAVENLGWKASLVAKKEAYHYLVLIPELANQAAAEKKSGELGRLGIVDIKVVELENQRHEIHLAEFKDEQGARDYLLGLSKKGVVSARQERRESNPLRFQIVITPSRAEPDEKLHAFLVNYAGVKGAPCPESSP